MRFLGKIWKRGPEEQFLEGTVRLEEYHRIVKGLGVELVDRLAKSMELSWDFSESSWELEVKKNKLAIETQS